MKTMISLLLLAVVNLIHCQEHEQMIVFTLQGIMEKLEGISYAMKGNEELLQGIPDVQKKIEHLENNLQDMQQKLRNLESNYQGAAVNNQESLQRLSREFGQCLRGDDLEHLTDVTAAAHQEIKSFHEEMSGVISLAQKDECSEGSLPCGQIGTCQDTLFGFTCSCPSGFPWDGSDCVDIDECIQGIADCNKNLATCNNTPGSYSCSCIPPFVGDGRTCSCPPGFALNGDICEDINECAQGKGVCHSKATCKNIIGSYSCSCNKPFEGDGRTSCACLASQRVLCSILGLE